MFILDDGKLVDSSDCIIMKSTERMDIHKKIIYAGDIVKIIDPGNSYLNENFSGLGYIVFDINKSQFIWHGFEYYDFPRYGMSGKAFEIIGNVFEDKKLIYENKKPDSNLSGLCKLSDKKNHEFIHKFFERSPDVCKRQVLIEKFISPQLMAVRAEEEKRLRTGKVEEQRRTLRAIAESKRRERYRQIYESIKKDIDEGKACI